MGYMSTWQCANTLMAYVPVRLCNNAVIAYAAQHRATLCFHSELASPAVKPGRKLQNCAVVFLLGHASFYLEVAMHFFNVGVHIRFVKYIARAFCQNAPYQTPSKP
eukprot:357713-Chlamydomonas_euryale.AAC.9